MELKPCPWCGGDVTIIYRSASNMFHIYHCDDSGKCDIVGPFKIHKSRAATLEEAAELWNRRAAAIAEVDAITVEWLEEKRENASEGDSLDVGIAEVLDMWEKEQEAR